MLRTGKQRGGVWPGPGPGRCGPGRTPLPAPRRGPPSARASGRTTGRAQPGGRSLARPSRRGDLNPGTWPRRLTEALRSQWSRGSLPGGHNSRRWLWVRGGGTAGGGVPRATAWRCPGARVRDGGLPRRGSGPRRGRSLRQRPRQAEGGEEERAGSPSLHLPSAARTGHWPKPRGRGRARGLGDTVPAWETQSRPYRCVLGRRVPGTAAVTGTPDEPRPAVRRPAARLGGALALPAARRRSLLVLLRLPAAVPLRPRVTREQRDTPIPDRPGGLAPSAPAGLACLSSPAWPCHVLPVPRLPPPPAGPPPPSAHQPAV